MPPRQRQAATKAAEAYNYASAEKLNNPTSETALGMEPQDLADQAIPELEEEEERVRHPRLQWNRGKQTDHSRTIGPLYIHDKVSPEQFLKALPKTSPQRDMWALLNGLPDVVPEFCGFSLDELADLQYVGRETVNGLSTRHYSATLDGEPWELWVAPNVSPAKVLASKTGVGFTMPFSRWDEPQSSTHNGQGLAPGGETRRHEQPQRTDHRTRCYLSNSALASC